MFAVVEVTKVYNRRGDVIETREREVFHCAEAMEATAYRFGRAPKDCHWLSLNDKRSISLTTRDADGNHVGFEDVYRITEGQAAYDAVMNGDAAPVAEVSWIASKVAN